MAGTIITSKLIMQLQDEISGNAAKVVTALDKVKGSEHALGIEAGKLNDASKRLKDFGRLDVQVNETSAALDKMRERLKMLGGAILSTDGPTKGLEKQYRAAQKAADLLTGRLDVQKKALGEVGAAYEKLAGTPINSAASAQQHLRGEVEQTTAALKRQMIASTEARRVEETNAKRRQAIADLKSNVAMLGGPVILRGAEEGIRSGATVQHERTRLRALGKSITEEQISEIERNGLEIASKYKTVTQADMMHMQRNAVTILGSVEEAMKIAEPMAKLRVIADAQHPGQSSDEDFDQLIKGLEIGGATKDPKKFESYMDGIAKGLNAFGDTVKPFQYYEMFKYGRGATPMLSQDFMLSIAPALGGELGGSSFGKAVSGFEQTIVSGRMKKQAGQMFAHLGLVRPQDLQEGAGGQVSVKRGSSIKGWQLAQQDPFEWVRTVLLPAIERKGIKDPQQQAKIVGQLFGDSTVQQLVSIMLMQKDRILKDQRIVRGAKGSESYKDYLTEDAFPALNGLTTALKTFTGTITAPGMERAAHILDAISTGIGHASEAYGAFAANNPKAAEAVGDIATAVTLAVGGKLTYSLGAGILKTLTGGGAGAALATSATALDGSALALDKSALAIEAAAGRLGIGGAVGGAESAAEKKAGGLLSKLAPVLPWLGPAGVVLGGTAAVGGVLASGDPNKALLSGGRPDVQPQDNYLGLPGFATGGYTGAGGRNQAAGIVHRGEYVFDADTTSRFFQVMHALQGGTIRLPSVSSASGVSSAGLTHVALATDSTSAGMLHDTMARAVYDAMRRIKGEGGLGTDGTGYGGAGGAGGGVPNLRYGRNAVGGRNSTPGTGFYGDPSKSLLDLIAKSEGAGYNVSWGNGRFLPGGKEQNLTGKSLNEILALGDTMRRQPGARNSSALGRYQITGSTLRDLMGRLHLNGSEKFDEAMQDRLASKLISDEGPRALGRWEGLKRGSYMGQAQALLRSGSVAARGDGSAVGSVGAGDAVGIAGSLVGQREAGASRALGHIMHAGEWCADFVNGTIEKAGGKGSGSAMASSFMNWGKSVAIADAKRGDVIMENSGRGTRVHHAGLVESVDRDKSGRVTGIHMISGNYGHMVKRNLEPFGIIAGLRRGEDAEAAEARRRAILSPAAPGARRAEKHAAGIDFDHSGLDTAIAKVDTLHGKLRALKATASVDINHKHTHENQRAASAERLSPYRSHEPAMAGRRITV